ncbi:hypothetical protein DSC45_19870 [Streptomyces sp. YIM 130001]|uniref:hypothetical protein n=1 Tax=Streptomyces sp. YIM 130001 TaxID=2259644 RepID=UPI000E6527B7|nr:hypothetical protein [Streptomyces sp. YIM 130001]RII14611.1 hypothetical protein DSC45_19870 [Streptomyces sp. YIM 130001]
MNAQNRATADVVVELSDCTRDDARTVFAVLGDAFHCDRGADQAPKEDSAGHPSVWTTTYDTSRERGMAPAAPLGGEVTADIQGGYAAVDRLHEALAAAFAIRGEATASGDGEKDVHLTLASSG